ncbi:hypothetical protein QTV44_002591 [Vibrio vulnificus]|nr:hypothetical protein [Vibrio vulnificus]
MNLNLPSFTAITNTISDWVSAHSFGYCQFLAPSVHDKYTLIATDGACLTAYEMVGMPRYLTNDTELDFIDQVERDTVNILRTPNHKIDLMFVRDPERTSVQLDDIFRAAQDTATRLGINAQHFFEEQKKDLNANCAYERAILVITTTAAEAKDNQQEVITLNDEKIIIESMPKEAQSTLKESLSLVQAHRAFCSNFHATLKPHIALKELTADDYLQSIKEEEELLPLTQTRWRTKRSGDDIDIALHSNEEDFITHPPLSYQLITNDKTRLKEDQSLLEGNSKVFATIDREYFPIDAAPFSRLFTQLKPTTPIRLCFSFELGTEQLINKLASRQTFLLLFLFSKQSRNIDASIRNIIDYAEVENKALLEGRLTIMTWGNSIEQAKENKREIYQAATAWGSQTMRTPTDTFKAYYSTLPAFVKTPSARPCIQPAFKHITQQPITRPVAPMTTGGMCTSSLDGRLFPIDPATETQAYSLNVIMGSMGSGKTVFAAIYNNTYIFGKGNAELPLMAYIDYGSGVHNYTRALKNWLSTEEQYKVACLRLSNTRGNAYNILEPQFGLSVLEEQERAFAKSFVTRLVMGSSERPIHEQISAVISAIIETTFKEYAQYPLHYESRIAIYVKGEERLHSEIEELIQKGALTISETEQKSWYAIRDKLWDYNKEKYFAHARFCHRQGSPTLMHLLKVCQQHAGLKQQFEVYKTPTNDPLLAYIATSLESMIQQFDYVLAYASQIDVSQARVVGIDLKGVTGEGSDAETIKTRRLFGMLAKQIASKNFWREPDEFMNLVPERYREMYSRIVKIDMAIKKHEFIDEYKQHKSPELDSLLDNQALVQRKYNMATTLAMQQFSHAPEGFLELATNVYALSLAESDAKLIQQRYTLTNSFISEAMRLTGGTTGFGRTILYIGKFKRISGYVVQLLRNQITSSLLWNFASGQDDENIKAMARRRYGEKQAFLKLAKAFPSGSADSEIEEKINNSKYSRVKQTKEDIILEIVDKLANVEVN